MRLLLFFGIFVQISGLSHHRNTRSITNGDNAGADVRDLAIDYLTFRGRGGLCITTRAKLFLLRSSTNIRS